MGVLQKLYELIFEILFLSEPCFGFVFLRRACYRRVLQSSIPRAFPIGIGVEYPVLEIICLDLESGLTMGDFAVGKFLPRRKTGYARTVERGFLSVFMKGDFGISTVSLQHDGQLFCVSKEPRCHHTIGSA